MKKYFFTSILALALAILSTGDISAQDSETRALGSFSGIAVSSSVNTTIQKGAKNSAEITVNGVELDKVKTEVEDGILKVGMKKNKGNWSWMKKTKVSVTITYTEDPEYLSVSSSGDLVGKDVIRSQKLELKGSSSGDMKIEIDVDELEASASSSADLVISGSAKNASVSASSSADFIGKDLNVNHAKLSASSSADVYVRVNQSIDAKASSSGDIIYYGNPEKKNMSKSSSGDITQKKA